MAWACKTDSNTGGLIQLILLTEEGVEHLYEEQAEDLMKYYEKWLKERDARIARSKSKKEQMKKDGEGKM
ncbi:hypothetical protein MKX03_000117 [Papaver bracteatum]|nr:hypothetical protein MKX03_000117 [Papaver bracteatum]